LGTIASIIGTGTYSLTALSDILKLFSVKFDGVALTGLSQQNADEFIATYDQGNLTSGVPTHYWVFANKITLFPVPSLVKNISVYYIRKPLAVAVDGDTPEIPVQYHTQIVDYCIAKAMQQDNNLNGYLTKMQEFKGNIQESFTDKSWAEQNAYPSISVSRDDSGWWDACGY
jgi:hypothetical protein